MEKDSSATQGDHQLPDDQETNDSYIAELCNRECDSSEQ